MHFSIDIRGLYIAPGHRFYGQPGGAPAEHPIVEQASVECIAGQGLKGDRFFGFKENFKGQATFFSVEVLEAVKAHAGAPACPDWATRRNVLIAGVDLNLLIGRRFRIGEVVFEGAEECAPCDWMDFAIGRGARVFLAGRGGLRARILESGTLSTGPGELSVPSLDQFAFAEAPVKT